MRKTTILLMLAVLTIPCVAATITVNWDGSGDYTTIQTGIDAANPGDTVIVADGTYTGLGNRDIDFLGKAITVRSENGPENCIIDCQSSGRGFFFQSREGNDSVVDGFSIINGYANYYSAGITCLVDEDIPYEISSPTIKNCIIENNDGEGIFNYNWGGTEDVIISNCIIRNNNSCGISVINDEGGLFPNMNVNNCLISGNTGSGINVCMLNTTTVNNCTITNNGTGISNSEQWGMVDIINSIIWGNSIFQVWARDLEISVNYSNIQDGQGGIYDPYILTWGDGNIQNNPLFVNGAIGDYHLKGTSPCIDAGTNSPPGGLPAEDLDGNVRPQDGDGDGQAIADMGPYEFFDPGKPYIETTPSQFQFTAFKDGDDPNDQTLTIRNTGGVILNWEIVESCDWLDVSLLSGNLAHNESDEVDLSIDISGLTWGQYACDVTIYDPNAMNNPQIVNVSLLINDELCVPFQYETIQSAIDAAFNGDIIIVDPNTYYENINFNGKDIILTSIDPTDPNIVRDTIIDGSSGAGAVVTFGGTETGSCELAGFTITGGYSTAGGGGVRGNGTYANIANCVITGNTTELSGGGFWVFKGNISNCKIIGNSAGGTGGASVGCQGRIENCVISDNTATTCGGVNNSDGDIVNCTIANNSSSEYGGLRYCDGTITNCIIWGNSSPEIYVSSGPTYSCFVGGGGNGNIDADPMFVNGALGDYHLQPNSLCIDAGTNSPPGGLPSEDFDGNSRPQDGDHDGVITADMGTYEIVPTESVIGLSANQYDFTVEEYLGNPAEQILSVSNYGVDTLSWTIEESCDWLTALPDSGSSMGEPDDVTLSVDISGLSQGNYSCDLMVSDPNAANSPQTVTASLTYECIFNDSPMYDDWVGVGKPWNRPDCWCYERHCRGDADGKKIGLFWVQTDDLAIFASAFAKPDFQLDQTKICGDFDHKKVGMFRIQTDDLAIFASYFSKAPVNVPVCPLDWDGDGDDDYNFWVIP